MKEAIIKFETAKLAKEKGYDISTYPFYFKGALKQVISSSEANEEREFIYFAPTQSLLQKWLREEHFLSVEVRSHCPQHTKQILWMYAIKELSPQYTSKKRVGGFELISECIEEALQESLKLI